MLAKTTHRAVYQSHQLWKTCYSECNLASQSSSPSLLLFCTQPTTAGSIIFWKRGCAADAVPPLPVSWYSFHRPRKDDRSGQVWEHVPEQRVAASTFRRYSRGLRHQQMPADRKPSFTSIRGMAHTLMNHLACETMDDSL